MKANYSSGFKTIWHYMTASLALRHIDGMTFPDSETNYFVSPLNRTYLI